MRRAISLLVAVMALHAPVFAQSAPETDAMHQIRPEAIRAHMRFLADDLLEGRGTATRGHELAAKYVAAQFEAMGLEPAGLNHTYYQPVPLRRLQLLPDQASVTVIRNGREKKLVLEKDFVMPGSPIYPEQSLRAPAAFVGFGVNAPGLGYDDYADIDVRGKIVVMVVGAPSRFPSTERAHYSAGQVKVREAVARGAIGTITIWAGEAEKNTPFERLVGFYRQPEFRWIDSQGRPNDSFPEIRGSAGISHEAARALFAGAAKQLDQALADCQGGKPHSFNLPVTIAIHQVTRHTPAESPNVAAVLHGSDPALSGQYVLYTAHADHNGIGPAVDGDPIYNGAVDNASGTAALIEVARAFSQLPHPPRRSILFVAVTGEEAGLLGSDFFARRPTVPPESLAAVVNMDEIGVLYDFRDFVALGEEHSSLGKIVYEAARRMDLKVSPDPQPEEVFFIRSDQYSFVRQGVPAVAINAGFQAADPAIDGRKTSLDWRAGIYHTPKDDLKQPLNFDAAARYARLNFLVGYLTAQSDERPTWNPGDFFGALFGKPWSRQP